MTMPLPHVNEVVGEVMLLHQSVTLSSGGYDVLLLWLSGPMSFLLGVWDHLMVCLWGSGLSQGGRRS